MFNELDSKTRNSLPNSFGLPNSFERHVFKQARSETRSGSRVGFRFTVAEAAKAFGEQSNRSKLLASSATLSPLHSD